MRNYITSIIAFCAIACATAAPTFAQDKAALKAPEISESYNSMIEAGHAEAQVKAHAELAAELETLLAKLHAAESAGVRPINDYLAPTRRELQTIDDWFAEAVRRNPDRVTEFLAERDRRIEAVWSAFRRNRTREYQGVRVTKDDYKHASRGPVTTPGGTRGKTERTCRVEAPSDDYTLISARRTVHAPQGDTHVGGIAYMSRGRGCTIYFYAKARSFGQTTRSRIGVTLYGTFGLKNVVINSRVASDERWLKDRT